MREIAAWPAWEIRLLEAYLAKIPAPEDRIERAIARMTANYVNRTRNKGEQPKQVEDYLPYCDPWPDLNRYSELDREVFAAFRR